MGEILNAHVPPQQRLLIQAIDQDRREMISMMRQAIMDGIRQTQLPRPVRAAKAGLTTSSGNTTGYPEDIPNDFDSVGLVVVPVVSNIVVWTPDEDRMALAFLAGCRENAVGSIGHYFLSTDPDLTSTDGQVPHRIEFSLPGGSSIYFPIGRGMPVTAKRPLRASAALANRDLALTIFHGPVRE